MSFGFVGEIRRERALAIWGGPLAMSWDVVMTGEKGRKGRKRMRLSSAFSWKRSSNTSQQETCSLSRRKACPVLSLSEEQRKEEKRKSRPSDPGQSRV